MTSGSMRVDPGLVTGPTTVATTSPLGRGGVDADIPSADQNGVIPARQGMRMRNPCKPPL